MGPGDEIRWIKTGIVAGLCSSILHPTIIFAPLALKPAVLCWPGWRRQDDKRPGPSRRRVSGNSQVEEGMI